MRCCISSNKVHRQPIQILDWLLHSSTISFSQRLVSCYIEIGNPNQPNMYFCTHTIHRQPIQILDWLLHSLTISFSQLFVCCYIETRNPNQPNMYFCTHTRTSTHLPGRWSLTPAFTRQRHDFSANDITKAQHHVSSYPCFLQCRFAGASLPFTPSSIRIIVQYDVD